MADFIYLMETRLTPDQQRAVTLVTDIARAHELAEHPVHRGRIVVVL